MDSPLVSVEVPAAEHTPSTKADETTLSNFVFERILTISNEKCYACIYGSMLELPTIIVLRKNGWELAALQALPTAIQSCTIKSANGKWKNLSCIFQTSTVLNVISPATEVDIKKYTISNCVVVSETPEHYQQITLPHIVKAVETNQPDITWVNRILTGESEIDRVLLKAPTHVIVKGFRWDDTNLSELNCLVIVGDKSIRSIRDLTGNHLNLLRSLRADIYKCMLETYNIDSLHLRVFVHYQPTFYHFHVHVISNQSTNGYQAGKCHFLDEIISNIEIKDTYYQQATIVYEMSEEKLQMTQVKQV